jgi:hypothetical protein
MPYKCIALFLLSLPLNLQAQNNFNSEADTLTQDSISAVRNAIKADPVQIVFGEYLLYYERWLPQNFSIEAGAGITRRNYGAGWFDYSLDNLGENVDIQTGYTLSLALRKYFMETGELYGPYLALGFEHKKYLSDFSATDSLGELAGSPFRDERNYLSVSLTGGYQALPISSNIFADFYLGVALRYKDFQIVKSQNASNNSDYFIDGLQEYAFGIEAGIKVGFGF